MPPDRDREGARVYLFSVLNVMDWRNRFCLLCLGILLGGGLIYAFILFVDPYGNVPFSLDIDRVPISQNQRFAYPSVAKSEKFDSVIIGTSTARLLDPKRLTWFGHRFANLAMNSATPYEQRKMLGLFMKFHPNPRAILLSIDSVWCDDSYGPVDFTFRTFPEWMYDSSVFNDLLYLFNDKSLENSVRMIEYWIGRREPRYRMDGYRDFTLDRPEWNAESVSRRLHGDRVRPLPKKMDIASLKARNHQFTRLEQLADSLAGIPPETDIIFFFPPLHGRVIDSRRALFSECKGELDELTARRESFKILDYLHVDEITLDDKNYYDPLHFTRAVAEMVENDIAILLQGARPDPPVDERRMR